MANPDIRLVATDLDGTLLRHDGTVSDRTRAALAAARDADLPVMFVTGRPPRWMARVADETGHVGTAICANGAVVMDLADEIVLRRTEIPAEVGVEVVRRARELASGRVTFAVERSQVGPRPRGTGHGGHHSEFAREHAYEPRLVPPDGVRTQDAEDLVASGDVIKVLFRIDASVEHTDSYAARATEALGDLVHVTHSASDLLLECSAIGVTKAATLAEMVAAKGLSAEQVAAVGDMPNDLDMLRWAGHSYAISGGHRSVLATADQVLSGPHEDGVAGLIESVLALRG